jgi:hypothetical protein
MTARDDRRADPLLRSASVDLSTSLISQLHELTLSLDGDDHAMDGSLVALTVDLELAVPSYCGLQLTITQHGFPVVLTAFAEFEGTVATSLRLPLSLLNPVLEVPSQVVFYARTPGALVDLAADLTYALRGAGATDWAPRDGHEGDGLRQIDGHKGIGLRRIDGHRSAIVLDADLPPSTRVSGLYGLADLSTINRAVGVLIANGHHPDDAHDTLRQQAAAVGLEPHAWAIRLLRR